ncbi:MFS transporter [Micromonospora sp. NPDC049523]|uniref:MFS transporter n=1 Tax=Micromonospora sp. NPDC049523 TaxID=3155921 RepID=UPI003441D240
MVTSERTISTARSGLVVHRTPRALLALCFAVLVLDGYDVVMFGAVVPSLLRADGWALDRGDIGVLGAMAVVGMLLGALVAGALVDRRGRRPVLVLSVVVFSIGMAICALAPTPGVLGAGRLVVGLGVGSLMPTVAALVAEYAAPGRRHLDQGIVFGGIGVGGALSGLLSLSLATDGGFRAMFVAGVLPAFVLVPVLLRWLPESAEHLIAQGREREARAQLARFSIDAEIVPAAPVPFTSARGSGSWRLLVGTGYRVRTLLFWATTFLSLLILFGASTWLPVLMTAVGYSLGSALAFLLTLNLGVVAASLTAAPLADRFGSRRVISLSFIAAAVAFVLLAQGPPVAIGFVLVAVVGVGAVGTQLLVNAYIAASYPASHRARALGTALGIGRLGGIIGPLYGGWLLADRFPNELGFYGFALPALLAGLVIIAVRTAGPGPAAARR